MQSIATGSVGWIGIGRMGFELAGRLADGGCDLAVYNRTRAKAEPLAERGATIVDAIGDLAGRDAVFSCVSASADFEEVVRAVLDGPDKPGLIIDASTVSAESSAKVRALAAEHGVDFLAVAISGNPKVVRAGMLTLAVSGPKAAFGLCDGQAPAEETIERAFFAAHVQPGSGGSASARIFLARSRSSSATIRRRGRTPRLPSITLIWASKTRCSTPASFSTACAKER